MRSPRPRRDRGTGALLGAASGGARNLVRRLGWGPRDAIGFLVGAVALASILINVLFMQSGSHPAPMFNGAAAPAKQPVTASIPPAAISRARPLDLPTAPPSPKSASLSSARSPGEIINDIQRELARRGYYDGPVDGV